ncbi:MBL fold metallo-hydrolase [Neorickettsia sennetsu]|uniref:Metallo-beta-lactamase family protein n=1 Tax=Ehrlichia sennetsu (strain ATCC VR-367 / Miyayama) TaxID=222891 RepID=Q2GDI5_EHRS3|nr:MBL fold metallo-hydrolase [Neorickettsia sennetsu]ABD46302.1 metallo-beta-lactamase family protein [Neorickettsia sennetsu str. Miyayama]
MKITVLGCGNSSGVPVLGCACSVCLSSNPLDTRTRCSVFVETASTRLLIDASPDLRAQAMREGFSSVDQVFYTHIHFDHHAGTHELSSFATSEGNCIHVFSDEFTISHIESLYGYLFKPEHLSNAMWKRCYLSAKVVPYYEEFAVGDMLCMIFPQTHGSINSCGIILNGKFAYCTDVRLIPDRALDIMKSLELEVFIIECFDYQSSYAHSNFSEALEYINLIQPKSAFFTHMTHKLAYDDLLTRLKVSGVSHVMPAHDGLSLEI